MSQSNGAKDGSLLARLREEKEWAVLQLLEHKEPIHRALILRALFESAVKGNDDEAAARIASWVLHNRGEETQLSPLKESGNPMSTEARKEDAVRAARAVEAMELWKLLPEKRVEKVPVRVSEDDFERRACDFPAMLVTKKALLNEIVSRWCDTKDEEEADRLFSFVRGLVQVQRSVRWFEEEQKIFMDAVRDGTGIRFPSDRAARHYLEIDRTRRDKGFFGFDFEREFGRMLAIAFMRNGTDEQRAKAMQIALPMLDASEEAVASLAKIATGLAELDRKVSGLLKALGWSRYSSPFAVKRVFPEGGGVILTLEFRPHDFYGFYCTTTGRQFDENKVHDKFTLLSQTVEGWVKENGCGPVTLVMVVPNEYKPDEPLFRRERTFK